MRGEFTIPFITTIVRLLQRHNEIMRILNYGWLFRRKSFDKWGYHFRLVSFGTLMGNCFWSQLAHKLKLARCIDKPDFLYQSNILWQYCNTLQSLFLQHLIFLIKLHIYIWYLSDIYLYILKRVEWILHKISVDIWYLVYAR